MFLSERNGISYLWYRDDAGNEYKVRTGARVKADTLHLLRGFDQESRPMKRSGHPLFVFRQGPVRICPLQLHGPGILSACQWLNKLATLGLAPIRELVSYIIRTRYKRAPA